MTEGGATRMKRNGARLFKNPPQPHMCIQDFIQGCGVPCYVNVLSWEKITMPVNPSIPVPLYGGMRVRPPRTKADAVVFAVMSNPKYLQLNGKNATDPKSRSCLIKHLLDFVETENAGVIFTRQYTILKDRDITGELKDVWNAVQAKRDSEQSLPQQETWIDAKPPVPQYPQYQDHQQQEYTSQPPQYHTSLAYSRVMSNGGIHYESYSHQSQTQVIPQNDQMYQSAQIVPQVFHGIGPRITQDRYNDMDRSRENMVQSMHQQNCPACTVRECHVLPRRMDTLYSSVDSYVHPNLNLHYGPPANVNFNPTINTNLATPFQPHIAYQQRMDNTIHRMQPQQKQKHLKRVDPVLHYEPTMSFRVTSQINLQRLGRPHMGFAQKNNASKRQVNSPTHSKQSSCTNCQKKDHSDNGTKPKSPVKVLQRELSTNNRQDANHHTFTDSKVLAEKGSVEETENVQVTDLDEEVKKNNDSEGVANDTHGLGSALTTAGRDSPNSPEDVSLSAEKVDVPNGQNTSEPKYPKTKGMPMKGNKHKESTENNRTIRRVRFVSDEKNDSPKRSQTTVNSIIKSVFKIHPGMSGEETSSKRKSNGQAKVNAKTNGENEEPQQGYTILKKSDSITHEEVMNELAQISIQDCKEATEVSSVLS